MSKLPKYVYRNPDRHGTVRYYYRRNGKQIRLRKPVGSEEFFKELTDLIGGPVEYHRPRDGSLNRFIYFVCHGRKVKIGISQNWYKRYVQIRQGLPGRATILYVTTGNRQLERELHHRFAADHVSGEWFTYSQQIRDWIDDDRQARRANKDTKISVAPPGRTFANYLINLDI